MTPSTPTTRPAHHRRSDTQYRVLTPDTQCFSYDQLEELTNAYTDTDGVTSSPATRPRDPRHRRLQRHRPGGRQSHRGPAPYWDSYSYDALGDGSPPPRTTPRCPRRQQRHPKPDIQRLQPWRPAPTPQPPPRTPSSRTRPPVQPATTTSNYAYFANGAVKPATANPSATRHGARPHRSPTPPQMSPAPTPTTPTAPCFSRTTRPPTRRAVPALGRTAHSEHAAAAPAQSRASATTHSAPTA